MKGAANRGGLLTFSLFYSFLCRTNTGGNLPPAITVLSNRACNRFRNERHPLHSAACRDTNPVRHRFFHIAGLHKEVSGRSGLFVFIFDDSVVARDLDLERTMRQTAIRAVARRIEISGSTRHSGRFHTVLM